MSTREKGCGKSFVLVSLLLILLLVWKLEGKAAVEDSSTVDFVLVLDCSKTMEKSDPEGLSISAAKMFVDMIPMEKARIGVVGFGPNWGEEDSYYYEKNKDVNTFTKVAYSLSNVETEKEKESVKNAITDAESRRNEDDSYTTIGYALQAAVDMLDEGKTEPNQACIILMSDGRLTELGEEVDLYREGKIRKSKSLDKVLQQVKEKEWPIYCLELAFDIGKNENWLIPTGQYQMETIAKESGGEKVTAYSSLEVEQAFSDIFTRFYGVTPDEEITTIKKNKASMDFQIEEMMAETNITITGERMEEVTHIELTDPDGNTKRYDTSNQTDSRIVTFEDDDYIMVKLLLPKAGKWKVTAYGTNGIEIKFMAIPMRELSFQLNTSWNVEEKVPKGNQIEFQASFLYNETTISSETFYREYPAYLEILETGEKFQMEGGEDNYKGIVTFHDSGTFTVRAYVESGYFRNDRKETGEYVFQVENLPIELGDEIEDVTVGFQESIQIDCNKHFRNLDQDKVTYKVELDQTSGIQTEVDEADILTLTTGVKAGDFQIQVYANDGQMEEDLVQSFHIHVENQSLQKKGDETIVKTVSYNAEKLPDFLKKLFGVYVSGEEVLDASDYFEDPDEITPIYQISGLSENIPITVEAGEEGLYNIIGQEAGDTTFYLSASDASDVNISFKKEVTVKSVDIYDYIWSKYRTFFIVILAIFGLLLLMLISAFRKRKIYGGWEIRVDGRSCDLSAQVLKRKRKYLLDTILDQLGLPMCSNNRIFLVGGNRYTKPVHIYGLENAQKIQWRGNLYNVKGQKKLKKVTIKKFSTISFMINGFEIVLRRVS